MAHFSNSIPVNTFTANEPLSCSFSLRQTLLTNIIMSASTYFGLGWIFNVIASPSENNLKINKEYTNNT